MKHNPKRKIPQGFKMIYINPYENSLEKILSLWNNSNPDSQC